MSQRPEPMSLERVRELVGEPSEAAEAKVQDHVDRNIHRFIAHSPFVCVATAHADGTADCSPRGDHPGFVKVLDSRTLAIPDRVGNNRLDTFENLATDPRIGLVFLVPGHHESLRVNGTAYLSEDPDVLARLEAEGKTPKVAIIVRVQEAYLHCGRAILRARLWDPDGFALADHVPSMGEVIAARLGNTETSAGAIDEALAKSTYRNLY
ncbi:MAG TPA: pyridoxamine 5'-phosphate oxidase family protein [Nocardiopsis listeri]|uniref:MSMEG_1061 family FMN-dependent PPOX-type flavoprotein n=1 Tax=Nocardiopsis listeri TaxID=53440 RepID=UPI001DC93370|nr:MSMEG_1061 family FMN-dependent PPOX-type flavoprotein [Nocardiopsis listeri]HJE59457.1 pyridoxamine 5'-phosphate oxidase family protein [Nocardiopsis listeri]